LEKSAGKEDPVELDSNLALFGDMPRCSISGRRGSRRAVSRPSVSPATLKYHYSHRFPTYSVERNARFRPRVRPAAGRRPVAASSHRRSAGACAARGSVAAPSACARSRRAAVDIPVALSTSRGLRASNRGPRPRAVGRPSKAAVRARGASAGPGPGAIRIPRTPPGGEFDWGGTSVKE
jgi:hypothetical protein